MHSCYGDDFTTMENVKLTDIKNFNTELSACIDYLESFVSPIDGGGNYYADEALINIPSNIDNDICHSFVLYFDDILSELDCSPDDDLKLLDTEGNVLIFKHGGSK